MKKKKKATSTKVQINARVKKKERKRAGNWRNAFMKFMKGREREQLVTCDGIDSKKGHGR